MMSVPNLKHIVQAVRDSRDWDLSTRAGLCAYSHAVTLAVHAEDERFGALRKAPGQNHCVDPAGRLVAVDAVLFRSTGQSVDFNGDAAPGGRNSVEWQEDIPRYTNEDWLQPVGDVPIAPPSDAPPGAPPVDLTPLLVRLSALEERSTHLEALHAEVNKQLGAINDLIKRLSERARLGPPL